MINCNKCNKNFNSNSNYFIHNREIHTHTNCKYIKCDFCERDFYSPIFNKSKNIPYYIKCELCRDIQLKLNTNSLKSNTYVYKNDVKYFLDTGKYTQICQIYNCYNITKNSNKKCDDHISTDTSLCNGNKCNNYFILNEYNFCDSCRQRNDKSKMQSRYKLRDLKIKLGGTSCSYFFYTNLQNKKKLKIFRKSLLKIHLNGRWTLGF